MIQTILAFSLLDSAGWIAAILICLFLFVFILLAMAFHLLMSFASAWLQEKSEMLKLLRPTVESVTKAHEAVQRGELVDEEEPAAIRALAAMPRRMDSINHNVERTSDRVVGATIEFQARMAQVKMVAKAFLLPGLLRPPTSVDKQELEFNSPGYRRLMKEAEQVAALVHEKEEENTSSERFKDVPTH